ncbi:hypothetical protein FE697_014780 [Mumia zhuanghuii]|uniref:Htaa protein n=2 Tax=Mumia TaxID=1546255 RepID=A0ABW1QMY5_9ACTN|nr:MULTISPECIES: hypothetical protein [Mumia]KAA1422410.1 hypothetical protein FE697_014780 [Mumia zhuanghuii]
MKRHSSLALALAVGLVALITPLVPASADATTAREVSGATLRWGLSNETNNSAFAPGTYNFLSAGKVADPGVGGQTFKDAATWLNGKPAGWKAEAGNVAIEKRTVSGSYAAATWEGLKTSSTGASISPPTSKVFSDHQVVLSGGSGWADPDTGRAKIAWDGDFTVVFYSGMSFFFVSDPELSVARDGTGVLTATLSGFGSSLADPTVWTSVPARKVTLATLPSVDIDADGVTVAPAYEGVRNGAVDQSTTGTGWGSWPTSFIAWLADAGSASYWYSSGGAVDANKPPLPIAFAWVLGDTLAEDPEDPVGPVDPEPTTPTPKPTTPAPTTGGGPGGPGGSDGPASKAFTVSDAQLWWGVNQEMSNSAFAPGTYNLFSAGTVPNPGKGGQKLTQKDWKATSGNVRIEKATSSGGHRLATWSGLSTTPAGEPLGAATNGLLSDHTVVVDGGTGTVDPRKKTATIRWKGTFTALLYSGMSYFTVTDPVLTVSGGTARLDATLGGYATAREDTSVWKALTPTKVRLADAAVKSLSSARGFTVTPRFAGVRYDAPASAVAQNRAVSGWGAFPTSFLRFQEKVGTASYWYTSGASTDRFKAALPITVSYDADKPVKTPKADAPDDASNGTTPSTPQSPTGSSTGPTAAPATAPVAVVPPPAATVLGAAAVPVGTTEGVRPVAQPIGSSPPSWPWWAGGAMAAAALLVTAGSRFLVRRA